jgi:hypothetical protein
MNLIAFGFCPNGTTVFSAAIVEALCERRAWQRGKNGGHRPRYNYAEGIASIRGRADLLVCQTVGARKGRRSYAALPEGFVVASSL